MKGFGGVDSGNISKPLQPPKLLLAESSFFRDIQQGIGRGVAG